MLFPLTRCSPFVHLQLPQTNLSKKLRETHRTEWQTNQDANNSKKTSDEVSAAGRDLNWAKTRETIKYDM